jgi:hypothetical protein
LLLLLLLVHAAKRAMEGNSVIDANIHKWKRALIIHWSQCPAQQKEATKGITLQLHGAAEIASDLWKLTGRE